MSPLKVVRNENQLQGVATSHKWVTLPDGTTVFWTESTGRAWVQRGDEVVIEFCLPRVGDRGEWDTTINVAPIERYEPTTPVIWHYGAERIR